VLNFNVFVFFSVQGSNKKPKCTRNDYNLAYETFKKVTGTNDI
jgi:hypothetical protein